MVSHYSMHDNRNEILIKIGALFQFLQEDNFNNHSLTDLVTFPLFRMQVRHLEIF